MMTATDESDQKIRVSKFFDTAENWKGMMYTDHTDRFNRSMIRRKNYAFQMLRKAGALGGGRSLDIGCGCGVYSEELASSGSTPYGIDLSDEMIEVCRSKFNSVKGHFLPGDIENIPFGDHFFDLVLCVGVFGYLLDDTRAMQEVVRVIKPGGYFFLSVQNINSLSNFDYALRRRFYSNGTPGRYFAKPAAVTVPWVTSHTSPKLFYKSYYPRRLETTVEKFGFTTIDRMSLGYEFRLARRFHLAPNSVLCNVEETLEKISQKIPVSLLKYSGDTFSVLFRKN